MPSRRHVLVVGCGFPQLGLLRAAREQGFEITGADFNPKAIGVGLTDHFILASTGDAGAIENAFRQSRASGIATSGSELALTTTAKVAEELGLPFYADGDTVHRCQAKDAMRAGYQAAGLHVPAFEHCTEIGQVRSFAARFGYPLVIKPANGWGQRGVCRVEDEAHLLPAFDLACSVSHGNTGAVVEEHIRGHEVSVNGWIEDGMLAAYCVTDREVFPGSRPLGVMRSEIAPSLLDPRLVRSAVEVARAGARALGLRRGPCYSQVAVSADRAVLFETAARLGGGFDADVTRLHSGVDLYARLLGVAFQDSGLERAGAAGRSQPALVRFLAPSPGELLSIQGLEHARAMPGIVDAVIYPSPGDVLPALSDAAKRIGHILAVGSTRAEAVARADAAEAAIQLHVRAPHNPDLESLMILDRITEVLRDRKTRMRMSEADYWDERVKSRAGFARSVWHSQAFSAVWNERQTTLLDEVFDQCVGGIRGRQLLDVGCGTGRITRHLASRGAVATGTDFSAATVEAARAETQEQGLTARFEIGNIAEPPLPFDAASFDVVVSVGCLAVACVDLVSLRRAFAELGRLTKPDGVIVVLEPVHSSRLLGRVLKAPVRAWIEQAESASLHLERRNGMGFVPVRLALSSFDLPGWLVDPAFRAGEMLLDSFPRALRLADYSLFCLRRGHCRA